MCCLLCVCAQIVLCSRLPCGDMRVYVVGVLMGVRVCCCKGSLSIMDLLSIMERFSSFRGKNVLPTYIHVVWCIGTCPLYKGVLYSECPLSAVPLYCNVQPKALLLTSKTGGGGGIEGETGTPTSAEPMDTSEYSKENTGSISRNMSYVLYMHVCSYMYLFWGEVSGDYDTSVLVVFQPL